VAVGTRREAALDASRARALSVPTWVWLGGIVVLSAAGYYVLGRRMVAPFIMTDELIYSELAKSFAHTGHFLVRDRPWQHVGPVYPTLISPAYAIFSHVPAAYAAVKAINAVLMSLAAVPAYFLARRVLSQRFALLASLLAVAIPSMLYTGTVMTENAFYPLFLTTALALVLALERPTIWRALLLFAAAALAFLTRAQGVAMLPAIMSAPLLLVFFRGGRLRALKAYYPIYGLAALAVVPAVIVQLARGRPVSGLFGRYSDVGSQHYTIGGVARWFVYHVAELDVYVGAIPFAALVLLVVLARRLPDRHQAFAACAVALSFWFVLVVAAYADSLNYVHRVEERNMFYVAPLLLIALLVWIERGMPRPRRLAVAAAVLAAGLPAVLPLGSLLGEQIVSDTPGLIPWWRLDLVTSATAARLVLVVAAVAAASLFVFLPRRLRLLLPAFVLCAFVTMTAFAQRQFRLESRGALAATVTRPPADWIDRAVPAGSTVAVLWTGQAHPVSIWEDEFFNRTAGPVYDLAGPLPGALPETRVSVDPRTGVLRGSGAARYALSDRSATIAGTPIARQLQGEFTLYRTSGRLRVTTLVTGLEAGDTWSGDKVVYTRFGCNGANNGVSLGANPMFSRQTVTARVGGRIVAKTSIGPAHPGFLLFPLVPRNGRCQATFTVRPTEVLPTGVRGATFSFGP
jgi:hypothetical protein